MRVDTNRRWRVVKADCLQALPRLPECSIDVIVTDPPYGLGIGGMAWDAADAAGFQTFCASWAEQCLRVLKPGGYLAAFGGPRTVHRMACGLEEAGFQLRDVLMWLYGQGVPKSLNLSGARRGWGTALRPCYEPILLARKPIRGGVKANVERHGTGALHIAASRIPASENGCPGEGRRHRSTVSEGRWPTNVLLSHALACEEARCDGGCPAALLGERSRFFYCAKASKTEREAGCERLPRHRLQTYRIDRASRERARTVPVANIHPTVKPLELMRWLVRLLTPPGGVVLDPFTGSGSTGAAAVLEGVRFLGIEREAEYVPIARARIGYWARVASREDALRGRGAADGT
jgi:DNA modification methylase